ncbi:MAG: YeeE/YedE family protein [Geodermatophilaceae bacterium]|nr:YeeE/YedE family protein [Geodermatophilaceae bacterium]
MITSAVTGALAGLLMGYVLQRGQLCFHSAIRNSLDGRFLLARGWALGVALASVGLALLFLLPGTSGLNQGLAFRPVANVAGGLVIGIGMVVAKSCVSGLSPTAQAGLDTGARPTPAATPTTPPPPPPAPGTGTPPAPSPAPPLAPTARTRQATSPPNRTRRTDPTAPKRWPPAPRWSAWPEPRTTAARPRSALAGR